MQSNDQALEYPDLISIIIPIYNTGVYLRETLDSCLNQLYKNIEIMAMDDHSNDPETLAILDEYALKDSRVKVHHLPENHGVSYGRNLGVDLCHGKYFCFLDHDDLLSEDCVGRLREAILQYDCDMAECTFKIFADPDYQKNSDDYRLMYLDNEEQSKEHLDVALYTRRDVLKQNCICKLTKLCWAKLLNTEKYRKAGLRFADVRYGEDIDWTIRVILSFDKYVSIRFIGLYYRLHAGAGSSAGSVPFFRGMCESWKRVYDQFTQDPKLQSYVPLVVQAFQDYSFYNYQFILNSKPEDKAAAVRYFLDSYRYVGVDIEKASKAHCFDFISAQYWVGLAQRLVTSQDQLLVFSLTSFYDPDSPELCAYLSLFSQLAHSQFRVIALSSNRNSKDQVMPQLDKIKQEAAKLRYFEDLHCSKLEVFKAPFNGVEHYVFERPSQITTTDLEELFFKVLNHNNIKAIALIGQDPFTLALGKAISNLGIPLISLRLNQELSYQERSTSITQSLIASKIVEPSQGQVSEQVPVPEQVSEHTSCPSLSLVQDFAVSPTHDMQIYQSEPWAKLTTSLACMGYVLPDYKQEDYELEQRKFITFLHPTCEQGLAIVLKLMLEIKQRYPQQQFMLVQNQANDLVKQLQRIHDTQGQGFLALKPDLSNLKIMAYPQDFSEVWKKSKVLLQFAPAHFNLHALSLEALYNEVPVIATKVGGEAPLGMFNLQVPKETQQNVTCMPDTVSIQPYVEALQNILKLSPEELKARCTKMLEAYQKANVFAKWSNMFKSIMEQEL